MELLPKIRYWRPVTNVQIFCLRAGPRNCSHGGVFTSGGGGRVVQTNPRPAPPRAPLSLSKRLHHQDRFPDPGRVDYSSNAPRVLSRLPSLRFWALRRKSRGTSCEEAVDLCHPRITTSFFPALQHQLFGQPLVSSHNTPGLSCVSYPNSPFWKASTSRLATSTQPAGSTVPFPIHSVHPPQEPTYPTANNTHAGHRPKDQNSSRSRKANRAIVSSAHQPTCRPRTRLRASSPRLRLSLASCLISNHPTCTHLSRGTHPTLSTDPGLPDYYLLVSISACLPHGAAMAAGCHRKPSVASAIAFDGGPDGLIYPGIGRALPRYRVVG